jgi:hypothetical protein
VEVRTPVARRAEIHGDKGCDGTAETVPELPLRPARPAPAGTAAGAPVFDAYRIRLIDLNRQVLAGMIPEAVADAHLLIGRITVAGFLVAFSLSQVQ